MVASTEQIARVAAMVAVLTVSATVLAEAQPPIGAPPPVAQPAAPPAAPPVTSASSPSATKNPASGVFASEAGLVLNFIKADKTSDFESVVATLKAVLRKSDKAERRQQADGWKVFKSPDAMTGGSVLYVFVIDPVVKGADYTISKALAEGLSQAELLEVYTKYANAYASGQNVVNMTPIAEGRVNDDGRDTSSRTPVTPTEAAGNSPSAVPAK